MQGILSSRNAAIAVLAVFAGFLLTRYLGRRMGDARRDARAEVDRVLGELATAMGGRFEEGGKLTDHPLLGELHIYGTTHVTRGALTIEVGVSYPADDLRDDRTTVRIRRPPDRQWRVATLHQRERPPYSIDPGTADAQLARCFEVAGGTEALPPRAREALLKVGALTFAIDLKADALDLIAAPEDRTVYIADVNKLRALVDETAQLAESLMK